MNLYKNRRDDYVRKRLQFDIDTILIYRIFATFFLLWQTEANNVDNLYHSKLICKQ